MRELAGRATLQETVNRCNTYQTEVLAEDDRERKPAPYATVYLQGHHSNPCTGETGLQNSAMCPLGTPSWQTAEPRPNMLCGPTATPLRLG